MFVGFVCAPFLALFLLIYAKLWHFSIAFWAFPLPFYVNVVVVLISFGLPFGSE